MDVADVQRKLQKLLASSASPNEAEAKSAMNKASALMEQYNIRTCDVDEATNEVGISTFCVNGYNAEHTTWESTLAAAIAEPLDAKAVINRTADGWCVMFIASVTESELILDLYKRLRRIISKKGKLYAASRKGNSIELIKSYTYGITETVYQRLLTLYRDCPDERALVVVKKDAIQNKFDNMYSGIPEQENEGGSNKQAYLQGRKDGETIGLNRSIKHNNV